MLAVLGSKKRNLDYLINIVLNVFGPAFYFEKIGHIAAQNREIGTKLQKAPPDGPPKDVGIGSKYMNTLLKKLPTLKKMLYSIVAVYARRRRLPHTGSPHFRRFVRRSGAL